ncbi:MAG TPA: hypothetical protein VMX58_04970 [Patescibacteria group bacterium]|nr:hypothetical protein [Patescibacteria group bacterium]
MYGPSYRIRLITVSGGYLAADWLEFTTVTAIEEQTWGAIKAQFGT